MLLSDLTSPLLHLLPGSNQEQERSGCKHLFTHIPEIFIIGPVKQAKYLRTSEGGKDAKSDPLFKFHPPTEEAGSTDRPEQEAAGVECDGEEEACVEKR